MMLLFANVNGRKEDLHTTWCFPFLFPLPPISLHRRLRHALRFLLHRILPRRVGLSPRGGVFEIKYLAMLSAHSGYWTSQDFIRFLVVEIGRKQGKEWTLATMRASKKNRGKR